VYWGLAARLYSAEELGGEAALISTMQFLSYLTQLNLRVALVRFVPEAGNHTARFVALSFFASGLAAFVVSTAFILVIRTFLPGSSQLSTLFQPAFAVWFILSTVAWSFFTLQDGLLTGLRRASIVPLENGLYSVAKIGLLILFAVALDRYAIFLSWTIPSLVLVIAVSVYAFGRLIPRHARMTANRQSMMRPRRLVAFLALDYVASLFPTLSVSLLPILIVAAVGPGPGAHFYIAWVLVTSLQLVPNYLAASLTVEAVGDMAGFVRHARRTIVHMLKLLVPAVLVLAWASPIVLSVFGPDYAAEGSDLLRVALLGLVPYGVNILFVGIARVQGRGRIIVAVHAGIALSTLTLTAALVPLLGITGVGVAWLLSNSAMCLVVVVYGLKPFFALKGPPPTGTAARSGR